MVAATRTTSLIQPARKSADEARTALATVQVRYDVARENARRLFTDVLANQVQA